MTATIRLGLLRVFWSFGNPLVILLARWTAVWGVLETRGRRTGQARLVPLALTRDGATVWVVVASGRNAAYVRNIEADPSVRIRIKGLATRRRINRYSPGFLAIVSEIAESS